MLRHDHEALLHGAIDNTLTLAERDALGELLGTDADARQRFFRTRRVQIGDAHHVQAARALRLGQEHGAELAGADQSDTQRLSRSIPVEQQLVQIHDALR